MSEPNGGKAPKTTWMLDTYIIIFFVVLFMAALTYVVPVGQYDTHEVHYTMGDKEKSKTVLIPESFRIVSDDSGAPLRKGIGLFEPGGETGVLNYAFEGLVSGDKWGSAVGVVAFILLIGGAFGIILRTGAIESGILHTIGRLRGREVLLLPILFVLFSLGGAVFGMGEEAIPFVLILCPVCVALGYDSVTALLVSYVATQIGFATSWMNPFSVAIAQGISQIPVLSAAGFRMGLWGFFTLLGIAYTLRYARRVKENPRLSISYESDAFFRKDMEQEQTREGQGHPFVLGHKLVILAVVLGIAWVIWGVVEEGYYIPEIATQFFVMGLVAGILGVVFRLGDMRLNDIASSFRTGAQDLLGAALVVGMAKGIILVLGGTDPSAPTVLNTLLHGVGEAFKGLPPAFSAWCMYVFQSVFNFFVVSGSGQAALTMPLMAPLSDLLGVARQVAVLAFQLGDGFTNLIVPTSGVLMACLGAARIDWASWAKWQIRFQGILFLFGSLFVVGGVFLGLR